MDRVWNSTDLTKGPGITHQDDENVSSSASRNLGKVVFVCVSGASMDCVFTFLDVLLVSRLLLHRPLVAVLPDVSGLLVSIFILIS